MRTRTTGDAGGLRSRLEALLWRRRRVLSLVAVAWLVLVVLRGSGMANEGDVEASLGALLEERDLQLEQGSLVWAEPDPGLLGHRAALLVARRPGELADVWFAEVRASSSGAVLDLASLTNLTRTSSAEEGALVRTGEHAAYASRVGDRYDAIVLLDLAGEPEEATAGWPARARWQNAVTNFQETGRFEGFGQRRYSLSPPAEELTLLGEEGRFVARADGEFVMFDPSHVEPVRGAGRVEARPADKAMPGTITWLVDTVRGLSFVGPEPIAWLEHRVFQVKDLAERLWHATAAGEQDTEAEVAEELGVSVEETRRRLALSATDPEIGWPPAPLEPVLDGYGEVRGEGEWMPVVDDPFLRSYPNAPPAFFQTFLRVDPERLYVRVYVIVFDPRQLQLRIMTGTREPESATGETGPGMVPRDEETLTELVAGFNGGFQATHGEFGMKSQGRVYLPPKPWAATVGVYRDGRVALGSWKPPPDGVDVYEERWALAQIPDGMVEYNQNLTSVVEGDRYNPWRRWYWGAAPLNAEDQTYIDRSGLCLTEEGFLAYFWGRSMGPEQLGDAMLAARCERGMHLDMNLRHTGFEFYDIRPEDAPHPPLERKLHDEDEWQGPVPHADGFVGRARIAVRSMAPMRFPRYIRRDPRDFFYLTLKPVLPGPHLEPDGGAKGAGQFSTEGLPHAGWPHAFARTFLGGEGKQRTWLVRMDPRRAPPAPVAADEAGRALAHLTGAAPAGPGVAHALYAVREQVGWRYAVGAPPEGAIPIVAGPPLAKVPGAGAALAVDPDGFLLYAEREPEDPVGLQQRLAAAGAQHAVALPEARLAFEVDGQHVAPNAYERPVDPERALAFRAASRPATEVLFPDVEPRPYGVWARLQDSRVRYFKDDDAPRFTRPSDDEDGGTPQSE